jgi:hypothetical protein
MAGTGGTYSSSSAGIGLCTVVCFGAGRRDVDDEVDIRCKDPVEVLAEFMLKQEVADKTEL